MFRRDSEALLRLLEGAWPPDALQLIGDGLVDAVRSGAEGAEAPARRCSSELRKRDWEGDDVLADALDALLGSKPTPALRPLPVSLEDVSTGLEGDGFTSGGRIDLATGEFRPEFDLEYADLTDEDEDDDEREWLQIDGRGSRDGYRDMEAFIERIDDAAIADLLGVAIQGRGAFRRFKDTLSRWPDQFEAWFSFSEDRQLGRAREWLAEQGYTPTRD